MIRHGSRFAWAVFALAGLLVWITWPDTPWCETQSARKLRERNLSGPVFPTIVALLEGVANGETAIFAHRGGIDCEELDRAPENSLANVEKAVRMGFAGYETDLWRTSDGAFVIHHDNRLGRTTYPLLQDKGDRPRAVENTSLGEIRELRLKYPSGRVSSEQVPTLRELLEAGRHRILFLVELKGDSPLYFPEILSIVEEAGAQDQVLFWITWKLEFVERFQSHLQLGIEGVRRVVWRVKDLEEYDDVVGRFAPQIIDLKPTWNALRWNDYFRILPRMHVLMVDRALDQGTVVLVSRLSSDSYLQLLYEKGVRVFMSRAPERHLTRLIEVACSPGGQQPWGCED